MRTRRSFATWPQRPPEPLVVWPWDRKRGSVVGAPHAAPGSRVETPLLGVGRSKRRPYEPHPHVVPRHVGNPIGSSEPTGGANMPGQTQQPNILVLWGDDIG